MMTLTIIVLSYLAAVFLLSWKREQINRWLVSWYVLLGVAALAMGATAGNDGLQIAVSAAIAIIALILLLAPQIAARRKQTN